MEITYHWEGDYLIPDLKLSDTTEYQYRKVWKNEAAVFEGESRGHLFVYDFVRNLMETSCGN